MSINEVSKFSSELGKKQRAYEKEQNILKKMKLKEEFLKLKSEKDKLVQDRERLQQYKNLVASDKAKKRKEMAETKVVVNNHVDTKNFDNNFSGISDFFVSMFGP